MPRIWIENRCDASEAAQYALEHGVQVVDNACSLLALEPRNVHWRHRRILSLVGREPIVKQPVRTESGTASQGRP
jgi:hypothetical protein